MAVIILPMRWFTLDINPRGYYASGGTPNYTRKREYEDFKVLVSRLLVGQGLALPLVATRDAQLCFATIARFPDWAGCDPENVHKAVKDVVFYNPRTVSTCVRKLMTKEQQALLPGKGSGDKYTAGFYAPYLVDSAHPRIELGIAPIEGTDELLEAWRAKF